MIELGLVEVLGHLFGVDALGHVDRAVNVGEADDLHAALAEQFDERCADLAVSLDDDALLVGAALECRSSAMVQIVTPSDVAPA